MIWFLSFTDCCWWCSKCSSNHTTTWFKIWGGYHFWEESYDTKWRNHLFCFGRCGKFGEVCSLLFMYNNMYTLDLTLGSRMCKLKLWWASQYFLLLLRFKTQSLELMLGSNLGHWLICICCSSSCFWFLQYLKVQCVTLLTLLTG